MRLARMLQAVDLHAAGEPGRVIVGGVLDVPGATMFDKMRHLAEHGDGLRKLMLREPRGYPALSANVILPPTHPEAQAGYVIMEQVEYPGMSGSNTICVATALLETGMLPMTEPVTEVTLEAPAGLIRVTATARTARSPASPSATCPRSRRTWTPRWRCRRWAPSRSMSRGAACSMSIADATPFGLRLTPDEGRDITRITELIKAAAAEQLPVVHPEQPAFAGDHHRAAHPGPRTTRSTRPGTWSPSRPARSTGRSRRRGPASSTGRRAGRAPAPRWPCSTRRVAWASARTSATRASWARSSRDDCSRRRRSGRTRGRARRSRARAWITGFASYVVDPEGPIPRGLHRGRPVVTDQSGAGSGARAGPPGPGRPPADDPRA